MTEPQLPPNGFHWNQPEPTLRASEENHDARKPRWPWVLAIGMVTALVAASAFFLLRSSDSDPSEFPEAQIGTPIEQLVSFPLDHEPAPTGWTLSTADIGLPPQAYVGRRFASGDQNAYFVSQCDPEDCGASISWVYGIDTAAGSVLFPPVEITGDGQGPLLKCYPNGPSEALCLSPSENDADPNTVWVIDIERGKLMHSGPTDLDRRGSYPKLQAIGSRFGESRLVAEVDGKGIYGIGPNAELTWHIPGGPVASPRGYSGEDIPNVTLAVASPSTTDASSDGRYHVFSTIDGTDITPAAASGTTLDKAVVYNGGFAYEYSTGAKKNGILFYDNAGTQIGRTEGELYLLHSVEMPVAFDISKRRWNVYTTTGRTLISIPASTEVTKFRTIGTKFYVQTEPSGPDESWQQWDLLTALPGATCKIHLETLDYIASDGTTAITLDISGDHVTKATNLSNCRTQWESDIRSNFTRVGNRLIKPGDKGKSHQLLGPSV